MNKDSKIYFYISKFSENIITHVFLKITGKIYISEPKDKSKLRIQK